MIFLFCLCRESTIPMSVRKHLVCVSICNLYVCSMYDVWGMRHAGMRCGYMSCTIFADSLSVSDYCKFIYFIFLHNIFAFHKRVNDYGWFWIVPFVRWHNIVPTPSHTSLFSLFIFARFFQLLLLHHHHHYHHLSLRVMFFLLICLHSHSPLIIYVLMHIVIVIQW